MLRPSRSVYIAAIDPLRYEALLGQSDLFTITGSGSGETVVQQILFLCPDFLLLDGVLTGLDGLDLLDQIAAFMPAPPRTLYLGRDEKWLPLALLKGADEAVLRDISDPQFLRLAEKTAQKPLPKMADRWRETREEIAEKYAAVLGIPEALKGKDYICRAASLLACAPQLSASYSALLYPLMAAECGTSSRAVEKAIRTAVENTWLHGNLNAIQSLFGYSVDAERGKPTNAEFLSMLAGDVRRELAHRMENQARDKPGKMVKMS